MSQKEQWWLYIKLGGYILIPMVLLMLPASFFDKGQSICVSKLLLNKECYACGMTRAIMHLIHFDFSLALSFNKLSIIVFPILSFLWASSFFKDLSKLKQKNNGAD